MRQLTLLAIFACLSSAASATAPATAPLDGSGLSAQQIVEKNAAARGGLESWRKVEAMVWVGHIESTNVPAPRTRFVLEQKRPNKTRFEVKSPAGMGARIFDGSHGWKLRPARGASPEVQPFTAEELRYAHDAPGLDGPLMDYAAKGAAVVLDGRDEVEGRPAYRLKVTLASGVSHHVWVDAETFLDVKVDRVSRGPTGQPATEAMYYRDFRDVEGLQIPFEIESGEEKGADKMVIDKVVLNPPLDDRMFARPNQPRPRNMVPIDIRSPQSGQPGTPPGTLANPGAARPVAEPAAGSETR